MFCQQVCTQVTDSVTGQWEPDCSCWTWRRHTTDCFPLTEDLILIESNNSKQQQQQEQQQPNLEGQAYSVSTGLTQKLYKMAVERLLFTLSFITVVTTTRQLGDTGSGCTSKFLLPDRPFMVVWNHPSAGCEAHGIDLNLTAWDIVDNKKDAFAGDNMVIYYGLGHWPRIDYRTGTLQNGGVPQVSLKHKQPAAVSFMLI